MKNLFFLFLLSFLVSCHQAQRAHRTDKGQAFILTPEGDTIQRVIKSEAEWEKELSPEAYRVLRQAGTERAFTGEYWNNHAPGVYKCRACGFLLFESQTKYDSDCGWPSFYQPVNSYSVEEKPDSSFGMIRTEITCARCGGHLGHVFDDGPKPTGLRYCMNSVSLQFEEKTDSIKGH
jgi:peptide-methionine (R)-S-oxide reductase